MGILSLPLPPSPFSPSPSPSKPLNTKKPLLFPTRRRSFFPRPVSSSHAESNASASAFLESDPYSPSQIQPDPPGFRYKAVVPAEPSTESMIERVIFDFRFLALLAVGGSLAGSLLCFLNV